MNHKTITSNLIILSLIIGILSCSEKNTYEFLTNIPELNGVQEFKVSNESKGIELSSLDYGNHVLKAMGNISSESEPYAELPSFSDCSNAIIGKIAFGGRYILIIKSTECGIGYTSICGVVIRPTKETGNAIVLANYSGGSGAGQELSSVMKDGVIAQKLTESSWSATDEDFSQKTMKKYTVKITSTKEGVGFNYE